VKKERWWPQTRQEDRKLHSPKEGRIRGARVGAVPRRRRQLEGQPEREEGKREPGNIAIIIFVAIIIDSTDNDSDISIEIVQLQLVGKC
jgi:hypothetical protein